MSNHITRVPISAACGIGRKHNATRVAIFAIDHPDARQPNTLRRWAWAVLKARRGEHISQAGLNLIASRARA